MIVLFNRMDIIKNIINLTKLDTASIKISFLVHENFRPFLRAILDKNEELG